MGRTRLTMAAALTAAMLACLAWAGAARAQAPVAADFQKVTLDENTQNPMELDVAPDGRVFYIERDGRVRIWKPSTQQTTTAGTIPVTQSQENGLLGIQLAPDFAFSQWVYLFYSQLPDSPGVQVVSRFKMNGDTLELSSEQKILTFGHQVAECCHSSGSLYFGPDGSLYISTGDNTNPFDSGGFNPIDERSGRSSWDAQRTSGNTNDLNGKVLRIKPMEIPLGAPGVGTTYTIPAGNLFDEAADTDNKTRPEIFGMGFRNPFRFTVDPETGWVLGADYGPDASTTNANRGPQGSVEFNVLTQAGNYGWPYCIRANTPYNDYDFATSTSGAKFDCANLVNNSPNNTGRTNLPPAIGASAWMGYSETDPRFTPDLGTGGAPMGGPRYHYDPNLVSSRKFPEFYDDKWFIAEWNNGWIKTANLNASGAMTKVDAFAAGTGYKRPMDLEFGPDGALYVIEWGSGFNGNNADSGIYRIDYLKGDQNPVAKATATPTEGLAPLQVQFSSAGSSDPEGTAITYEWDFDGNGTTDSTSANATYTYTANGAYTAKLTVKDAGGLTGVSNVPITVGNRTPVVTIEIPENGQVASFNDRVPYKISVTDPEDGSTGSGISCSDVRVNIALGHDEHSHTLSSQTGCEGTFNTGLTSGHGAEANTFTVLGVSYTDKGGPGGIAPLTGRGEAILQPKTKQAEFFASTGRAPDGTTAGTAGVQTETTTDTAGGGLNIGFIEDGDYVSFKPFNLKDVSAMRFRVASAGPGGTIEVRLDSPTGTLVGTTETITPTGNWQVYKDVGLALSSPPSGTHELFLVFRNRGNTGSLMNLNWFELVGKGAATTAAPEVSITATPTAGTAPLSVLFDSTATDAEGKALTYAWDFGVPGTTTDVSTQQDPTYTYQAAGTYTATLTVTDADGGATTKTVGITVNPAGTACPTGFRDDFNGTDLASGWEVVRRDQNLVVADGKLKIPTQAGDIYQGTNTAKNIVLRPAPAGPWTATAKIKHKGLVQYQQAGLIVYGDDDNYTKLDRTATNTATGTNAEKFEFINEVAAVPRNQTADGTANLGANLAQDFWVRVVSDGTNITGAYSLDGTAWTTVGRAAALPANAKIGLLSLSNAAATTVTPEFDWFTLEGANVPVQFAGMGAGDEFTGSTLNKTRWNSIVREDTSLYSVTGGGLSATTVTGDIYQTGDASGTKNFFLQTADHAGTDYVLETKLTTNTVGGYSQGGIIVYTDDDNYVKFDAVSDVNQTRVNRIELRSEVAAAIQNPQPQITNVPTGTTTFYLRLTKAGTSYTGEYSYDGSTWTSIGQAVTNAQSAPRFGLFTLGVQDTGGKNVTFDYFKVDGNLGCEAGGTPNLTPVISSATASPSAGVAPLAVNLAAAATDADGDPLTYRWDFDDNGTTDATGATASTTFNDAGNFAPRLTVSDGRGGVSTRTVPVQVLPRDDAQARLRTLVFSKTAAFRHSNIDEGITAIKALGQTKGWQVDATEDTSLFRDDVLSHYDSVIWLSTTGDVLDDAQQAAFERFIRAGGGYTGIHAASDTEYTWPWYGQLVGAYFRNHPSGTPTATVDTEDVAHRTAASLPARWQRTDEWYNFQTFTNPVVGGGGTDFSPRANPVHVLLAMDETTYNEDDGNSTDDDHPIAWCKKFDGGRSWYTGMGHTEASFTETTFLAHLSEGVEIAAGVKPDADCGVAPQTNHAPTVTAARTPTGNVRVGVPVSFTATGADEDGDTLTYAWDFGDGDTSSVQNPTHTFLAAATRSVKVTVTDGKGGEASATLSVVVQANRNPTIAAGTVAAPQAGIAPLTVQLTGAATDPDGHAVSYSWDTDGDGTFETASQNATAVYNQPGTYSPALRVTDPFGGSSTRVLTVNVLSSQVDESARFRVLVFSKTAAFRHSAIDEGIAAIKKLGTEKGFAVDAIEESSLFTDAFLARYDVVLWMSTTGDVLNDDQQAAFERFIKAGGGYMGVHAASDTEYTWPWYGKLVGAYFRNHPNGTPTATIDVEDTDNHTTTGLPARWTRVDEWYNFQTNVNPVVGGGGVDFSPRNNPVHVLLRMDESTYAEADGSDGVDDDHPISWCQRYDGGRSWYTALGHTEASYVDPLVLGHLLGGLEVAAGVVSDPDCGVVKVDVPTDITGNVPATLALSLGTPGGFGMFVPGVSRTYDASLTANVTSTATAASLSVRDPSFTATGRLVNGSAALAQPVQVRAREGAFAPLSTTRLPVELLTWSGPVSNDTVTIDLRQAIGDKEPLLTGSYSKTIVFTLGTTTP